MKKLYIPSSVWPLLGANVVSGYFAIANHSPLSTLLWIFWAQSVLIGFFQGLKMWRLKRFNTDNLIINNKSVSPTEETKRRVVGFFAVHYSFFHFVYLLFLFVLASAADFWAVAISSTTFGVNHLLSYRANQTADSARAPSIGAMMFFPYLRVVPMHLAIIFALPFVGDIHALIFFLLLKTAADAAMHVVEHRRLGQ